jgi:hypothetical protein
MRAPKKKAGEKLRSWRVALMRSRTHYLGVVYAPDEKVAEAAAMAEFKIADEQRRRLIVRAEEDRSDLHPLLQHRLGLRGARPSPVGW